MAEPGAVTVKMIEQLPEELRERVLERACILFDSGLDWETADRRAYEMEVGAGAPGLARTKGEEEAENTPKSKRAG
jgi:hypothetical protein